MVVQLAHLKSYLAQVISVSLLRFFLTLLLLGFGSEISKCVYAWDCFSFLSVSFPFSVLFAGHGDLEMPHEELETTSEVTIRIRRLFRKKTEMKNKKNSVSDNLD